MHSTRTHSAAFTLIELLIVIAIVSTLVALAIPSSDAVREEQLRAAARIAAGHLDYARSLAMTYNSRYEVEFDARADRLILTHTGVDTTLDAIPASPFRASSDLADEHTLSLSDLAGIDVSIAIVRSYYDNGTLQATDTVEFGPLGETTRSEPTTVWLGLGTGSGKLYIPVTIAPVTGIATVGSLQDSAPPVVSVSMPVPVT